VFAAAVRASEQGVLAVERDWADSALDDVGIDLDAAVGNEARQPVPTRQRISDGLREFGLLANQTELGAQPGFELVGDRPALLLADGATLVGGAAADLGFDDVEPGDTFERSLAIGAGPAAASS
jgi:hypothetical protein